MSIEFSPAVLQALQLAQRLAPDGCQPVHLLQALAGDDDGQPAVVLTQAGVDREQLQSLFVEYAKGEATDGDFSLDWLPPSHWMHSVLRRARQWINRSPDHTLTSDQVLLALLQTDDALREQLESFGLDSARLDELVTGPPLQPLAMDETLDLEPANRDEWEVARLLDANANRAREALRVLEDFARFVLNDGVLSGKLKAMRHRLADALRSQPMLLESRDTVGDVGTSITTTQERERTTVLDVVSANSKRLQEALRCLEEYGKIRDPDFGSAIESIRYESYTIEKVLTRIVNARDRLADAKLYLLIAESACRLSLHGVISEAAAGGVQIVQLREKNLTDRLLLERAKTVREATRKAGVLFIMNDRVDIAIMAEADGVHLGQDDLPVQEARRIIGDDALIGVSTHSLDQLRQAVMDDADYIGVGPAFPSATKAFDAFPGMDFVREASAETSLPAFVLGGVTMEKLPQIIDAGGKRVAVGEAICQSDDPRKTARRMRAALEGK